MIQAKIWSAQKAVQRSIQELKKAEKALQKANESICAHEFTDTVIEDTKICWKCKKTIR